MSLQILLLSEAGQISLKLYMFFFNEIGVFLLQGINLNNNGTFSSKW